MFDSENESVQCPYEKSHLMPRKRLQSHLLKCRLQHPNVELVKCPFNSTHLVPEAELPYHVKQCSDRNLILQYKYGAAAEVEVVPQEVLPIQSDENWDDVNVNEYDPQKYVQSAKIVRLPMGRTPLERKEFIKTERKRLGDVDSSDDSSEPDDIAQFIIKKRKTLEAKDIGKKKSKFSDGKECEVEDKFSDIEEQGEHSGQFKKNESKFLAEENKTLGAYHTENEVAYYESPSHSRSHRSNCKQFSPSSSSSWAKSSRSLSPRPKASHSRSSNDQYYHLSFSKSKISSSKSYRSTAPDKPSNREHSNREHSNRERSKRVHSNREHSNREHSNRVHSNREYSNREHSNRPLNYSRERRQRYRSPSPQPLKPPSPPPPPIISNSVSWRTSK